MRLFFYINSVRKGGAERVLSNLSKQFALDGNYVVLATSFKADDEYELDSNVKRMYIDDKHIKRSFLHKNIIWTEKLRKMIKSEKPDVIISFMAEPNFRMLIAACGMNCKKIISVRNDPDKEYPNVIYKFLAKHLYKAADGVVFQTQSAMNWFPKTIRDSSMIIPNQVDSAFFNFKQRDIADGIVTTGRLTPQKNHKMLIDSFNLIKDKTKQNLTIFGEGNTRAELEEHIKILGLENRVFLPGLTKDVANAVGNSRLFVLSSDYEGMPNALMEAMALGVPCVSTDCPCGGPDMLLDGGKYGRLVPVGNIKAMADAMLESLENKQSADNLAELAKKRSELFRPENVFGQWKAYVLKVSSHH